MSLITRASTASMDASTGQLAPQITGLYAGEDLDVAAPCYIKSSDGKVYMSNGTSANEAAEFAGFTPRAVKSGQPVTLFGHGARFSYGTGLTPGDVYYIGATKGRLDTAATTGDTTGVAMAVTSTDIVVTRTSNVNLTTTASGSLTGTQVATVADANVIGGVPVLHRIDIADAATGDVDTVLTHKTRVIEAWAVKTGANGGGANTVQVKNGSTAITDAMSININNTLIVRAASIDDAQHEIAAGGTLRVTRTKAAGNAACIVYVLGIRVA